MSCPKPGGAVAPLAPRDPYAYAWIQSSEKDMNIRIGQAWIALNKMMKVWKSDLKNHLKVGFFRATVESVLLYGDECLYDDWKDKE